MRRRSAGCCAVNAPHCGARAELSREACDSRSDSTAFQHSWLCGWRDIVNNERGIPMATAHRSVASNGESWHGNWVAVKLCAWERV